MVVAVPLPPPVQRHQQQVLTGPARPGTRRRPGQVEHRLAQWAVHAVPVPRPGSGTPARAGRIRARKLRLHVLADQPVVAAEGDRRSGQETSSPQANSARGHSPARPSLGTPMQLCQVILIQVHACRAIAMPPLSRVSDRPARPDLQNPAFGPQPRDPQRRLDPARQRQP